LLVTVFFLICLPEIREAAVAVPAQAMMRAKSATMSEGEGRRDLPVMPR